MRSEHDCVAVVAVVCCVSSIGDPEAILHEGVDAADESDTLVTPAEETARYPTRNRQLSTKLL